MFFFFLFFFACILVSLSTQPGEEIINKKSSPPFRLGSCAGGRVEDVPESDFASACAFYLLEALLDRRA